jgi:hypothetical protein
VNKKDLSERDICTKFITPAIKQAGWDLQSQVREEVSFTKGRIIVRGKLVTRGKAKRADYILCYKPNIPLALIEAKDNNHALGDGIAGYHDAFNVAEPTIVIGRVGYYCGSVHVTPERAWVTDNAFITKFCTSEIFLRFLVLLLAGTNLKERENATAQPVISGSKIYPIVVGIPPSPNSTASSQKWMN